MALRKRGKQGLYSAYFRTVMTRPDGTLKYATRTVNLGTSDLRTARAMEQELLKKNAAARQHQRFLASMIALEVAAGERKSDEAVVITKDHRKKRLKINKALETAAKYREIGEAARRSWNMFAADVSLRYMDEVTPELAFSYLDRKYAGPKQAKSFNNVKGSLNVIFRSTLLESGMAESPFAKIPSRKIHPDHQRPFTVEEFQQIVKAAEEPYKTACIIAWFTGLRKKDVFTLKWSSIDGDVITTTPSKTSRFGRGVRIPIHPQLQQALDALPRVNEYVLGVEKYVHRGDGFGDLLRSLGIVDNERGIVNFNSFRDSFITRCDALGVARHATRGMVGQVDDQTTDLYSHDLESARKVQQLDWVCLE